MLIIGVKIFAIGIYKMTAKKPAIGSPEHLEQVRQKTSKIAKELLDPSKTPDFEEMGVLSGDESLLDKTDAELFPDEIEEQPPEERRKKIKVHVQE